MRIRLFLFAAFALVAVIPIVFFGVWPGSKALDKEIDEVRDRHLLLARNLGHALERYDRDLQTLFLILARNAIAGQSVLNAENVVDSLHFRHICIAHPDDPRIRFTVLTEKLSCPTRIPDERFKALKKLARPDTVTYSPVTRAPNGDPVLFLVALVDGHLAAATISTTYFVELGRAIAFGDKGHAAIVDHTGRILAHPLPSWRREMRDISQLLPVRQMLAGNTGIAQFYSPAIEADMIAGFTTVPGTGWGVMIPQPMRELEAKARDVKFFALGVILLGLFGAAIAGWFISGVITRPVRSVAVAAAAMASGSREARVGELPAPRLAELTELSATFNSMADAVDDALKSENDARLRAEAAREALSESHERFQAVVENSTSAIVLFDQANRFLLVNRRFLDWFDISEAKTVGKRPSEVVSVETASILTRLAEQVRSERRVVEQELDITLGDGKVHCLVITMFSVVNDETSEINVGAVLSDVSDQRQAEQRLQQSQRLEAIGQLTGGIAHDFNNILAIILGHAEYLANHEGAENRATQAIIRASRRGANLTRRLLTYARRQTLHPEIVSVEQALTNTQELLSRTLGEKVHVEIDVPGDIWSAMVDPSLLDSSILNLAINARDSMPAGGKLTMTAANTNIDAEMAARLEIGPGRYVTIAVRDTGLGIADTSLDHVFEPFFTTKKVGQGSGLGLSMVYGFVRQSGGQIEIESEESIGTAVTLFLPAVDLPWPASDMESEAMSGYTGAGQVLIVDDNEDVLETTERIVEMMGFTATTVTEADQAIAQLNSDSSYDFLISDVALPGALSGFDIALQARKRRPELGIVLMSGHSSDALDNGGAARNEFEILAKPFNARSLAQAFARAQAAGRAETV